VHYKQGESIMKLSYRGHDYNPTHISVTMTDPNKKATYRGVSYSLQQAQNLPPVSPHQFTYRGLSYTN